VSELAKKTPAAAAAKLPAAAAASRRPISTHTAFSEDSTRAAPRQDEPSAVIRLGGGLGEDLVSRGAPSPERLVQALSDHYPLGGRIGDAIVRLGFVARPELEELAAAYDRRESESAVA